MNDQLWNGTFWATLPFVSQAMETLPDRCVGVQMASVRVQEANAFCCVPGHSHRLAGFGGGSAQPGGGEAATGPGRWCRMRSSVSKQETALLLENCLPFHYRAIKLRSKSFTADKDPRYLLDKRA